MTPVTPTVLHLSSFTPDGEHETAQRLHIPEGFTGQQTVTLGDYEVILHPDGGLSVYLDTAVSEANRITVARFHESALTLRAVR